MSIYYQDERVTLHHGDCGCRVATTDADKDAINAKRADLAWAVTPDMAEDYWRTRFRWSLPESTARSARCRACGREAVICYYDGAPVRAYHPTGVDLVSDPCPAQLDLPYVPGVRSNDVHPGHVAPVTDPTPEKENPMPELKLTLSLVPAEVRADAERAADAGHHGTAHLLYKGLEALEDGTPEVRRALGLVTDEVTYDDPAAPRDEYPVLCHWLLDRAVVDTDGLVADLRSALERFAPEPDGSGGPLHAYTADDYRAAADTPADAPGDAVEPWEPAEHALRDASYAIPPVGPEGRPDPLPGLPEAADLLDALRTHGWDVAPTEDDDGAGEVDPGGVCRDDGTCDCDDRDDDGVTWIMVVGPSDLRAENVRHIIRVARLFTPAPERMHATETSVRVITLNPSNLTIQGHVADLIADYNKRNRDDTMDEPQEIGAAVVSTMLGSVLDPMVRYRTPNGQWAVWLKNRWGSMLPWSSLVDTRPATDDEARTGQVDR